MLISYSFLLKKRAFLWIFAHFCFISCHFLTYFPCLYCLSYAYWHASPHYWLINQDPHGNEPKKPRFPLNRDNFSCGFLWIFQVFATPAVVEHKLYVRTVKHIYAFGKWWRTSCRWTLRLRQANRKENPAMNDCSKFIVHRWTKNDEQWTTYIRL